METFVIVLFALFFVGLILLTLWLVWNTLFFITEEMYMHVFKRPIYVHFYPKQRKLTEVEEHILRQKFPFYNHLPPKHQSYFRHRVASFIAHHEFIGKENFVVTAEVRLMIAATSVMLTFGMRKYLFEVVSKVIIYPTAYLSTVTQEWHKGEFNPRMKTIVFSWEDFVAGFQQGNDNLNLGLHEFAHVVHYHGTKYQDSSAILFSNMYRRITTEMAVAENRQKLVDSDYFRVYGYTNSFEFLAVLIEHYFETPAEFEAEFPDLYQNVSLMLNHKHR